MIQGKRKRPLGLSPTAFVLSRRRPTFPPSCPGSSMGDAELNCRVRNGNGCDLRSMTTGNLISWLEVRAPFFANHKPRSTNHVSLNMGCSECTTADQHQIKAFMVKSNDRLVRIS